MKDMRIKHFLTGLIGTNMYVVFNDETKHAVVIDPAACPQEFINFIEKENLTIDAVILTHAHFDHIMGLTDLTNRYPVPVYVHEDDVAMITNPRLNQSVNYVRNGYTFNKVTAIEDGQVLHLAGFDFKVIHTPGHTMGCVCYYVEAENILFSGDTLFQNSVGRTDFETSSTSSLVRSIREKLFLLPDDVDVLPGHMGTTTIGHEKMYNPFV